MKPRHRFYVIVFGIAQGLPHEIRDLIYAALAGKAVEKPIAIRRKRMDAERRGVRPPTYPDTGGDQAGQVEADDPRRRDRS